MRSPTLWRSAAIAALFLAAGALGGRLLAPRAQAATYPRWQYWCTTPEAQVGFAGQKARDWATHLNEWGAQGWGSPFWITDGVLCMQRTIAGP